MLAARARLCAVVGLTTLAVGACAVLEPLIGSQEHVPFQQGRIDQSDRVLASLGEVDLLVHLDNELLGREIREGLQALAKGSESLTLSNVRIRFLHQYVALESDVRLEDAGSDFTEARLLGEVALSISDDRLLWLPRWHQGKKAPSIQMGEDAPENGATDNTRLLERVNTELSGLIAEHGNPFLDIGPMPLGILEAGASLIEFEGAVASEAKALGGVFTTAGSAVLVEPDTTRFALDLEFVPRFVECAGAVDVSRSGFTRDVVNREPVGMRRLVAPDEEIHHFYSEITGADRPTTVIHYWFADGEPVTVTELPVGASRRWRTWSSRQAEPVSANHWEVIVVEKDSGCILESMAIQTLSPHPGPAESDSTRVQRSFETYRGRFLEKTSGLDGSLERTDVALIEVRRAFFAGVLSAAMRDLQLVSSLGIDDGQTLNFNAELAAIDVASLSCEGRECTSGRECIVDYDECPVERDTRDCTSCLFRNPLNNRCVNEGQDPICEAARAARNARLERARQACVEREQDERMECERLRAQEIRSCELEVDMERSSCEVRRQVLEEQDALAPLASLHAEGRLNGPMTMTFSRFDLAPDLQRLSMDFGLRANLELAGQMRFEPDPGLGPLQECVEQWQGRFDSRILLPDWETGLTGAVEHHGSALSAPWTGFTNRVVMSPSPLQSLFVTQPGMLAACQIGLTIDHLSSAVSGAQGEFFRGEYAFSIQPLPTRIQLLPAWVELDSRLLTGEPELGEGNLVYRFEGGKLWQ